MAVSLSSRTPNCSIARTLEVVGERWSLLIVREAILGRTRFSDFRERLGIAPDVLTSRLAVLEEHGILQRSPYRDAAGRTRDEYLLTTAGRDLVPVLASLSQWGAAHLPAPAQPASVPVDAASGASVRVALLTDDGVEVAPAAIELRAPIPSA